MSGPLASVTAAAGSSAMPCPRAAAGPLSCDGRPMSAERLDYSNERQRHRRFVGRAGLLERLDRLLATDGWVVVTGGPGMGKSALLAAWLSRREAAGAAVPHHFIRRGEYDWDDPGKLVGSLVAQIEERFPAVRAPDTDARTHPAARLAAALARASAPELAPRGERLVVLIDGLDEYDPPAGAAPADPLAAFLPHALPDGVSVLCASRPRHPYVASVEARHGEVVRIDLDEADLAAENDATVRAFWDLAAPELGLDVRFVDEAVARAGGNLQHAATLRQHLAGLPAARRRAPDIPRGLAALLARSWERVASEPAVVDGLGILCAAREALTLDELGAVAGWTGVAPRRAFERGARELLVETRRPDGEAEYRLHHDSIRAHIAGALGAAALRAHHGALAGRLATWPPPTDPAARRYALRHALIHRAEAGAWEDAWRIAGDTAFLEAKCRALGAHEAEADVARLAERCRRSGDAALCRRFDDLARALARESHWLRAAPEAVAALVWNRLRRFGWSADELDQELRIPDEARFLRVRHAATRESPALVRDLVGHTLRVTACAVIADRRRVISASDDRTLKIWDLDSGQVLATLEGHVKGVSACAVTSDGRRGVSASRDRALKVWDLENGNVLATLTAHDARVNGCAFTPNGRHVISASADRTLKIWDLESGRVLATLEGHTRPVNACVVTPDGQRIVSASADGTLKIWDFEGGRMLATLKGHQLGVNACVVMPDGRRVVSASSDRTLRIWDLESEQLLSVLEGHAGDVRACAVTGDGRRVISASDDRTLKVWDLETGRVLSTLESHAFKVSSCVVTADGGYVVSASGDRMLKVWDLGGENRIGNPDSHASWVSACALTADGRRAVSASDDRTLKVWDLESGRVLTRMVNPAGYVTACAVTMDGRVISGSYDRTLKVWDLESGHAVATLEGDAGWVNACAVTADGRRVISASTDRTLKVWDLERGRAIAILEGHDGWVRACAVTEDGRRVVSGSYDRTLKVWDLESGHVLATLEGHTGDIQACAVTRDGRRAVSASQDSTLKVWDLESGCAVATLEGHTGEVSSCAVTADGQWVISASGDRTLRVWDLETGTCIFTHRGDTAYSTVAATSSVIVAGDASGVVWVLDWPSPSRRAKLLGYGHGARIPAGSQLDEERPRPAPKKHTILFLAANPVGTDRLALDQEAREIQAELERSGFRDSFELVTRWAVQPLDLLRELRKIRPTVVHFSGHGCRGAAAGARRAGLAPHRDVVTEPGAGSGAGGEPEEGLLFVGPDGRPQRVSTRALEETFGAAGASVKLVALSACYSEQQAAALLAHVDCVVGMSGAILDDAARSFAIGFYGGLGERESVAAAYQQGRAAISLEGLPGSELPQLKIRAGVDASRLVLATGPR
jgi:WD40 repeat protein